MDGWMRPDGWMDEARWMDEATKNGPKVYQIETFLDLIRFIMRFVSF